MKANKPTHYDYYRGPEFATELRANVSQLERNDRGNDAPWDEIISAVISLEDRVRKLELGEARTGAGSQSEDPPSLR